MATVIQPNVLIWTTRLARGAGHVRRNPVERGSVIRPEDVESHRSLSCPSYGVCLDTAERLGWKSWSCRRCLHFPRR